MMAETYYEQEVANGADPAEVKADIARELTRVLLIEQDRDQGATPLQARAESQSIQDISIDKVKEFVDSLGTDDVKSGRPNLEPKVEPVEVEFKDETPDAEQTVAELTPVEEQAALRESAEQEAAEVTAEQIEEQKLIDEYKQDITEGKIDREQAQTELADAGLDPATLDAAEPSVDPATLDAAEPSVDPDQERFDDDPAMQGATQGEIEALKRRTELGTERKALVDTFFGANSDENLDIYDATGELRYDTPISVTEILRTVAESEANPDLKNLATTLTNRFNALENAGVTPPKVVAGGMDYEIELAGGRDAGAPTASAGRFFVGQNLIYLNTDQRVPEGLSFQTALHEATHGVLVPAVAIGRQPENQNTELGKTVAELDDIQGVIQENLNTVLKPLEPYAFIEGR